MSDTLEVWAPFHAWRALAQLRAEAAVGPLLTLLSRIDEFGDDWVSEDLPKVFGHIGQAAIEPLTHYLANPSHGLWARVAAVNSFAEIGKRHPDLRNQCVASLTQQLRQFKKLDPILNGFIINYLVDLQAVESASFMEQAFAANRVDIAILGDWEDAQIMLGLLHERLTPPPNYGLLHGLLNPQASEDQKSSEPRQEKHRRTGAPETKSKAKIRAKLKTQSKAKAKAKARRRQQKKARKKQRKRK